MDEGVEGPDTQSLPRRRAGDAVAERFEILRGLGSGGNATVWLVTDRRDGEAKALKVLDEFDPARETFRRFRYELEVHSRIAPNTPGVLPIIESHVPGSPRFDDPAWALMPEAVPLQKHLNTVRFLRDVVAIFAALAETLRDLHASDIKHRDIKPANLFMYRGRPAFGDFGLASFPGKDDITTDRRQVGARNFTAPEMIRDPEHADGKKADVYSLALTLWVAAVNQRWPLPGEYSADRKPYRISDYLSAADPAATWQSRSLDLLIARSTNVDPGVRPTMTDVARELAAWLAPTPEPSHSLDLGDLVAEFAPVIASQQDKRNETQWVEEQRTRLRRVFEQALNPIVKAVTSVVADAQSGQMYLVGSTFMTQDQTRPQIQRLSEIGHPVQATVGGWHCSLGIYAQFNRETLVLSAAAVVRGPLHGSEYRYAMTESAHWTVPIESAQEAKALMQASDWLHSWTRPTIQRLLEESRREVSSPG